MIIRQTMTMGEEEEDEEEEDRRASLRAGKTGSAALRHGQDGGGGRMSNGTL